MKFGSVVREHLGTPGGISGGDVIAAHQGR